MDVRAFQDSTELLRRQQCLMHRPILHLKVHIWGDSMEEITTLQAISSYLKGKVQYHVGDLYLGKDCGLKPR